MTLARRLKVLHKRRDFLAQPGRPRSDHSKAELATLTWAIRVLENALELGILHDLSAVEPLDLLLAKRLAEGQSIEQVAHSLYMRPTELQSEVQRLCRLYLCEPAELATAIAATRSAA